MKEIIENVVRPVCNNCCPCPHDECTQPCDKVRDKVIEIAGEVPPPYSGAIDYSSLCKFDGKRFNVQGKNEIIYDIVPTEVLALYGLI